MHWTRFGWEIGFSNFSEFIQNWDVQFSPIFVFWALLLKNQTATTRSISGVRSSSSDCRELSTIPLKYQTNKTKKNENRKKGCSPQTDSMINFIQSNLMTCRFASLLLIAWLPDKLAVVSTQAVASGRLARVHCHVHQLKSFMFGWEF